MNDSKEDGERDPVLVELFRESHGDLAPEPFVSATRRRVQHERRRMRFVKSGSLTLVIVLVAICSQWLIAASTRLSELLEAGFALVSDWLGTPIGVFAALVVGAVAALRYRLRLWR